ncbi:CehA/McbA family metallohydrolase [Haloarcula sp. S1AR25-5A]|uniref:CehA/McbA family metallohydrolase n=1 Tax=Haloarcula terrestris TaxID=2950533 RepID=A0AAE4JGR1_9EURY|nr:CehA/McbA family metallohydrolase [Haloarcula terrestris]MDS0221722.1 CehA/McbA family metallohydrolase [Haloarcula terrestris]
MDRNHMRSVILSTVLVLSVISTASLGSAATAPTDQSELSTVNSGMTTQMASEERVTCQLNQSCPVPDDSVDLNNSGAGVDVLIDGSHQGSTFTEFANRLSERGYDVDTKRSTSGGLTSWNSSSADGLSDYDVVIIPVPQTAYSDAEQAAIDEYVRSGGSLFVVGDWTSPLQGHAGKLNDITDPYGLHFNGESDKWLRNIQDPTNKTVEEYEWRVVLHNTGQHPIMNGVDTVEYDGVSLNVTDTENGTQAPLLYGDNDTYEYTYSTTEKEYPRGQRIVGAAATWDIGDNGRVVAFGSQKSLTTYLTDEWQAEHQQTDTRPFLFRTVKWLAASGHVERPDKPVAVTGERIKGGETPANETIVLKNSEVAAAIGTETNGPFGALPGGIYDANAYGLTTDEIAVAEFAFDDFGTWPVYESFEHRNASGPDGSAVVVAEGHLQDREDVTITTTYTLPADSKHIWINTTMENGGDQRLPVNESEQLQSGAALSSESLSTWLPGEGSLEADRYTPTSADTLDQPWAALTGDRVSYGVWGGNGSFTAYTGAATWIDPWLEHRLDPGETQSAEFAFFVGEDGASSATSEYYNRQQGTETGTVTGTVRSTDNQSVSQATVTASQGDRAFTYTTGSETGTYDLELPAGEYTLTADASGFAASNPKTVTVSEGDTSTVDFDSLEGPAPVNVTATIDDEGEVSPADARITVLDGGTAVQTVYTQTTPAGTASFQLPPGNYTLVFNHGTGYIADPVEKNVSVTPGESVSVNATFTEALDPSERNWVGIDPHAHSSVSFDGKTPIDNFVAIQKSAGVDAVFISDHNAIGGWGSMESQAEERDIMFIRSEEITTGDLGHFNPYPMHGEEMVDSDGTLVEFIEESRSRHNATVFQINHPGDRFVSLDSAPGQHEAYLPMVDAIEAYNGPYGESDAASVQGLFTLWNEGYEITATGVSDDHCSQCFPAKYGSARTRAYVEGTVTPEKWAQSVKDGHTYATYGPAVEFTVDDRMPGETVNATAGSAVEASATVRNLDELAYAEVIRNGTTVANVTLDGTNDTMSTDVDVDGNAWVAFRVVDEDGDRALTSPVWISAGQQAESGTSGDGESGGASGTATPTDTDTEDESATTAAADTASAESETTAASGPGFTAAVTLLALVGAALFAARRRT